MLRVIVSKDNPEIIGYKCSECLSDVVHCDTVCKKCGRELVYPYFMPSTLWWGRHNAEERERVRREAFDITIALIRLRGTDWRDLKAPLNRFLGGEYADAFVRENLNVPEEQIDVVVMSRKKKLSDSLKGAQKIRQGIRKQLERESEERLRKLTFWEPKEKYPYGDRFIDKEEIRRLESQLPVTLVDERYLS